HVGAIVGHAVSGDGRLHDVLGRFGNEVARSAVFGKFHRVLMRGRERRTALLHAVTRRGGLAEAGGDDGDLYRVLHLLVHDGAENNVRIFVRGTLDDRAGLLHFGQFKRGRAGDVDEDAAGAVDGSGFEQRGADGFRRGFDRAFGAAGGGRTHDGVSHASHDGLHVGEVAVDDAGDGDDVGDPLHALAENVVGNAEGFEEAGVFGNGEQLFVGDDDGGVDRLHQFGDAALGLLHAAFAFERERLGDDGNGERAHFAGQGRDDGSGSGAGAAAESGGDKYHVGAFEGFDDLVGIFERSFAADFRIRACAQTIRQFHAELQLHGGVRHAQRLQVGVGDDEFNALDAGIDHAVDRVAAASTYADDFDLGVVAGLFVEADANAGIFAHCVPPIRKMFQSFKVSEFQGL